MEILWLVTVFTCAWRTGRTVPSTAPAPVNRKRVSLRSCIRFRKPFTSGGVEVRVHIDLQKR